MSATAQAPEPASAPRPEGAVRARVAALAAEVLPDLHPVPARLRRIADFAPARRARLGGEEILRALEADDGLRPALGPLVGARHGGSADVVEPVDRAALAWLVRDAGWESVYAAATDRLAAVTERETAAHAEEDLARAEERAARAETALREVRAERKAQVAELREEVASLRKRLGETRARERAARDEAEAARAETETARRDARGSATDADAERRRLRARVAELEAAHAALRRTGREERDEASLRARVLLDTVVEAAAGLRRELTLPTSDAAPADRVEQQLADRAVAGAGTTVGRDGPAALEQYLAAPRARLLVDGYNVSKSAWPESSLEAQRTRLLRALAPVVARTGADTTVVFDAAATEIRPTLVSPRGVRVLFSPPGVIADDVIAELVEAEPGGRVLVVVSSDAEVARHASRHGARSVGSDTLLALLA